MKTRMVVVIALVASLTTSCMTQKLWKATDPDAHSSIPQDQITEAELRERGIPYLKDDHGLYIVGKTRRERIGDHVLRAVFTPATMCLDATPVVAGALIAGAGGLFITDAGGSLVAW